MAMSGGRTGPEELTCGADVVVGGMDNRGPVGVSAGLPVKAKLLVKEVKGGSALYTGVDEAWEGIDGELFRGEVKAGSAGLRELVKLHGNEVAEE